MCEERGARFFVPERKYLGDNGAMIAYTGKLMLESGPSLAIERSQVNPSFRSDEVEVTWKHNGNCTPRIADSTPAPGINGESRPLSVSGTEARSSSGYPSSTGCLLSIKNSSRNGPVQRLGLSTRPEKGASPHPF